jgi:hypothetical protein
MTFRHEKSHRAVKVHLPARSASIMTKEARWDWTHAIDAHDFHGDRRVSLTFRQCNLAP